MVDDAPRDDRIDSRDGRSGPDDSRPPADEPVEEPNPADEERGRIPIDLSDGRDATPAGDDESADDQYAPEPRSTPIEPGTPHLENTVFVLLGVLLTLLVLFRLFTLAFV